MDITLILLVIGILFGIYLIFKFVKKLIFAVFSVILLFVVIVGSIFGLVYLDFKQLSSQTDFDVDVIYVNGQNYEFGTQVMIRNNSNIDLDSIKGLSKSELSLIDVSSIKKEDNLFIVEIDSVLFDSLIANNTFTFDQFANNDAFSSFTLEFTGEEISSLLVSNNAKEEFVTMILDKNNMKGALRIAAEGILNSEIDKLPFQIKEILFLVVMQNSMEDKNNVLALLKAYKNDEGIAVYPDRFTFKLVRMLPVNTIESYIPSMPSNPIN